MLRKKCDSFFLNRKIYARNRKNYPLFGSNISRNRTHYHFLGDKMTWFGNLPGDIHYKKDKFQIYAPLASMLLLSLVLGLIMWIARKIME